MEADAIHIRCRCGNHDNSVSGSDLSASAEISLAERTATNHPDMLLYGSVFGCGILRNIQVLGRAVH